MSSGSSTKGCLNAGEYARRVGEHSRELEKPVDMYGNKLFAYGKGEELLYCKACRDEATRSGVVY